MQKLLRVLHVALFWVRVLRILRVLAVFRGSVCGYFRTRSISGFDALGTLCTPSIFGFCATGTASTIILVLQYFARWCCECPQYQNTRHTRSMLGV